jgi:hypothetical protein
MRSCSGFDSLPTAFVTPPYYWAYSPASSITGQSEPYMSRAGPNARSTTSMYGCSPAEVQC